MQPLAMPPEAFGRIAAQTFKQVMIQKFRDDERKSIFEEFSKRVGEIATGTAQRYEGGALVVTDDRPRPSCRERADPRRAVQPGDRVRCLILDVRDCRLADQDRAQPRPPRLHQAPLRGRGPRGRRAHHRDQGHGPRGRLPHQDRRSSIDSKVDAVGACVGVRGSRIKNIVDELNGEKIDIVRWNESSQILIQNSLKPAEVAEISLCFELGAPPSSSATTSSASPSASAARTCASPPA
jgi:N utilization substance protein A